MAAEELEAAEFDLNFDNTSQLSQSVRDFSVPVRCKIEGSQKS